jgi:hypothetical protein
LAVASSAVGGAIVAAGILLMDTGSAFPFGIEGAGRSFGAELNSPTIAANGETGAAAAAGTRAAGIAGTFTAI